MPVGCGLCHRMWLWQLVVVGCPRVWRWQLDGLATHVCGAMADGRGWCPRVWRWQLEGVGFHVFGAANWM